MGYTALPTEVVLFIKEKQASYGWKNNQYRTNGKLHSNAFQKAYEINHTDENTDTTYTSCVTLDDLTQEINEQNTILWKQSPWKHYDVKSNIFTLEELHRYIQKRKQKSNKNS